MTQLLKPKKISESAIETTYLVLPAHTNALGTIFGGHIMSWIDMTASIVAFRHCRSVVVTASMDQMDFIHPVKLGDLVTLKASVNFASKNSVEIGVKVFSENPVSGKTHHTASAYLVFVSLDENGKVKPVPPVVPETPQQKKWHEEGEKRREEYLRKKRR